MWIWSALLPHPPVLIPEVGQGRENEASLTLRGITNLTSGLAKPDILLVLSPHQPYAPGALFVNSSDSYSGSFAVYGVPQVKLEAISPSSDRESLCSFLKQHDIDIYSRPIEDISRDQGSTVPLYFLRKAWGTLPEIIIASPIGLTPEQAFTMGKALSSFSNSKRWALLASGDLSHRLAPDAPAGYEPKHAPEFESAVEQALRLNDPKAIHSLDDVTLERAGECGLRSVMAMLGLCAGRKIEVFSHEWPFGVGYCTALCELEAKREQPAPVALARETVTQLLTHHPMPLNGDDVMPSSLWSERKACFVSIKTKSGELRGCIGTLSPIHDTLDQEIIANAVSSSIRDPRFPPMTRDELSNVVFSVDVLSEPEHIDSMSQLNPKKYGVIVSKGYRRGVLLPDLEGVDSVTQQVQIAAMKAGISDLDGITLERFTVTRYRESC